MIRKVGDYAWRQISRWEFAPKPCVERLKPIGNTGEIAHYILERVVEIVSPTHWRVETVKDKEGVPEDILKGGGA